MSVQGGGVGSSNVRLAAPASPLSARCLAILAGSRSAEASRKKMRDVRKRG